MIVYKNIIDKLKAAGHTTYALQKSGEISQSALTNIRQGKSISITTLNTICRLTKLQPGDLIEYVEDEV